MKFMKSFVLLLAMGSSVVAYSTEPHGQEQQRFFEVLEEDELAFIANGKLLEQALIDSLHEHMFIGLAAGKEREALLLEMKELVNARADSAFTVPQIAAVIGVGVIVLAGAICLVQFLREQSVVASASKKAEQKQPSVALDVSQSGVLIELQADHSNVPPVEQYHAEPNLGDNVAATLVNNPPPSGWAAVQPILQQVAQPSTLPVQVAAVKESQEPVKDIFAGVELDLANDSGRNRRRKKFTPGSYRMDEKKL